MSLPRRAYPTISALSAALLGGVVGWAWWWRRHRRGGRSSARVRRLRVGAVAAGLILIAIGTTWRVAAAVQSVSPCSPAGGTQAAAHRSLDASLVTEKALTWPETGLGMLYARADHSPVCLSRSAGYYVAVHADEVAGASATNVGDLVLSPRFNLTREQLRALAGHEARHRPQWAVATLIGGPLAFPVAYGIDNFFFPGSRNHFERMAGLESGLYPRTGTGPVLGPAQIAVLVAIPLIAFVWLTLRRRRVAASRMQSRGEQCRND